MNKHLIALLFFAAPRLFAAQGSLSVAPAVVMLSGQAGQTTTQTLALTNNTSAPMTFEMMAQDAIVRDGKRVFSDAGAIRGSIAATATFSQKRVTIAPGDTAHVSVTVTIPPEPQSRAIVALFHGVDRLERADGMKMTASVGTLLTFTLSDRIALDAAPLSVAPPTASSNLAVAQQCENRGSEPFVAKGVLAIVDRGGRLVGKTALPPHRLLPGERYDVKAEYGGELAQGRYRALLTYDLGTPQPVTSTAEFDVR
jgi:hypothetical protein